MKFIFLVLFTFNFFVVTAQAELPYSQKILLKAEFDRTEKKLRSQVDTLKKTRTLINSGEKVFREHQKNIEDLIVYSLENLYLTKNKRAFRQLVYALDSKEGRKNFYYPVQVTEGMSGVKTRYVSLDSHNCVYPKNEDAIQNGIIMSISTPAFKRFNLGDTKIIFTQKNPAAQTLAVLPVPEDLPVSSTTDRVTEVDLDLTRYYSCQNVQRFRKLEKENQDLLKRYNDLGRLLDLPTKNFSEEKEKQTLEEALSELKSGPAEAVSTSTDS